MPLKTWVGLILCNMVWALNPVMGKWVLLDFSPPQGAWLRYFLALLGYGALVPILRKSREFKGHKFYFNPKSGTERALIWTLAFMTFCYSPLTQMVGLASSHATENSLIIAMEPLMTVALAWIFLGERLGLKMVLIFSLALSGFGFLSDLLPWKGGLAFEGHIRGNVILLLSLLGEASYSVLSRKLMRKHEATEIFGSALLLGVVLLTFSVLFLQGTAIFHPAFFISTLTFKSLFGLIWLGPIGTTLSYLYWMVALKSNQIAGLALTLFIQPVLGAFFGRMFLGEKLELRQGFGAGLILAAVVIFIWAEIRSTKSGLKV
ncbi:MAG: DMT family transporter [Bdellovibrionota bacterium]